MVKEILQQKELVAKLRHDERIRKDPHALACGAELFSNKPGLARNMPEGLQEFTTHLVPGATPVRQGMCRFTAEETLEIRRQVTKISRDEGHLPVPHSVHRPVPGQGHSPRHSPLPMSPR
jgi:hypothetical protein